MKLSQTMLVLSRIAQGDNRQLDPVDADPSDPLQAPRLHHWHECIGDLDFEDALAAVTEHRRTSSEYLQPAHVRRLVGKVQARRVRPVDPTKVIPNVDPDDRAAWLAEHAAIIAAINAGRFDPQAYATSGGTLTQVPAPSRAAYEIGTGRRPAALEGPRLSGMFPRPPRPDAVHYGTGPLRPDVPAEVPEHQAAELEDARRAQTRALEEWAARNPVASTAGGES